jgi:hypothetical protein
MNRPPLPIGLMMCDLVIVDDKTRRITPVNCFSTREVKKPFPVELELSIVVGLVNGHGNGMAQLSIQRLDTMEAVFEKPFAVTFRDPLQEIWAIVPVRSCRFPEPMTYQAILTIDGIPIALRRFQLSKKEISNE